MPTVTEGLMKAKSFFIQVLAGILACFVTGVIHFKVQPITKINTTANAVAVAFSFWPGLIVGHIAIYFGRLIGEDELKLSVASEICALLWFVYLFRAATLLLGLPILSNWTQAPVNLLVKFFELFS
jgi:hypothetical protein